MISSFSLTFGDSQRFFISGISVLKSIQGSHGRHIVCKRRSSLFFDCIDVLPGVSLARSLQLGAQAANARVFPADSEIPVGSGWKVEIPLKRGSGRCGRGLSCKHCALDFAQKGATFSQPSLKKGVS